MITQKLETFSCMLHLKAIACLEKSNTRINAKQQLWLFDATFVILGFIKHTVVIDTVVTAGWLMQYWQIFSSFLYFLLLVHSPEISCKISEPCKMFQAFHSTPYNNSYLKPSLKEKSIFHLGVFYCRFLDYKEYIQTNKLLHSFASKTLKYLSSVLLLKYILQSATLHM